MCRGQMCWRFEAGTAGRCAIGSAGIVARREGGLVEVLSYLWSRGVGVGAKTVGVLLLGVQLEL